MGRGTLGEVWDGSLDPRGGPGRIGGPSSRSGTGRGTRWEVRDSSLDPRGGSQLVGGPSGRSGTGQGTIGWSGMSRWKSGRSGTYQCTLGKVRDGSMDPWRFP